MGKKGALLRQQKAEKTVYTFTRAQLQEHDHMVADMAIKAKIEELDEHVNKVWDARAKEFSNDGLEGDFIAYMQYMMSIPVYVLVNKFGWTPITKNDSRLKLVRFVNECIRIMNDIASDTDKDIRLSAKEFYEVTGVKFVKEFE